MRFTIVFAFAMLATAAWPCSKPDGLTLLALMHPTWTVRTGSTSLAVEPPEDGVDAMPTPMSSPSRAAKVAIAMPAIGRGDEAFRCLTWDVELILPPGIGVKTDDDGNPGATTYTGLESTATAEFDLTLPALPQNEVRDWQAWLRVKVRFPSDDAGVFLSYTNLPGGDQFMYPVTVQMVSGSAALGAPLAYAAPRTPLPALATTGIGAVLGVLAGDQP